MSDGASGAAPGAHGRRRRSGKPLDLSMASEQELVDAFMNEAILEDPPVLPVNMSAAIEFNRRLVGGATHVIEACRLGSGVMFAPLSTLPGSCIPGLLDALTVAHRMLCVVASNHERMAQLFPKKTLEDDRT